MREHIYFSGRVQGVGFRYRSYYLARGLGLTGWVRNLRDQRVEMEVQGREADISQLLDQLKNGSMIQITDIETEKIASVEEERSFRITE